MKTDLSHTQQWCQQYLDDEVAEKLDQGELSARALYSDLASNGFMQVMNDKDPIKGLVSLLKVVGAYSGSIANAVAVNASCATLLQMFGNDAQKTIAQDIISGTASAAFLLTEENAGSDVANIQTSAEKQSDGNWLLNGEKWFATGAQDADYLLLVARSDTDKPTQQSTSIFCIPANSDGITASPMPKIASLGFASCYVNIDQVSADENNIVGEVNAGWMAMAYTGTVERLLVAASSVGLSKRMLDYTGSYALQRQVEGQAIYQQQAINHQLVDAATRVHGAELMVDHAVETLSAGGNPTQAICMAKLFSSEIQQEVALTAMKVLGGRAYLSNSPVHRWQREGQLSLYAGGTNEIQKNLLARGLAKTF